MPEVLGQPRAQEILAAQLANGRVHHAYIFHGPVGVGKFLTALHFAKTLLCQNPQRTLTGAVEACGACPSCGMLPDRVDEPPIDDDADESPETDAAHPDLHVVRKELAKFSDDRATRDRKLTQIPVEVLRTALLEPVYRHAQMRGTFANKVFIVDEAELLNPTGQNLLLKTLEEPPAGTVIVLITSSEDRLLPTIRSRCQRVAFVPLSDEIVRKKVEAWDAAGRLTATDRAWLVEFAGGSLGRAELAIEYDLAAWARAVLPPIDGLAQGKAPPGGDLGAAIASMIDGFAGAWVDRHDNASKEAANKLAAGLMWSLIATHARRRLRDAGERLQGHDVFAAEAAAEPWLRVIDAVGETESLLASNVNLSIVCDHLVVRLAGALSPAGAPR